VKRACGRFCLLYLKLADCRLQYFVHSSVNMNPSHGIYGGTGAGLVNRCYILHTSTPSSFIEISHTDMTNLKVERDKFPLRCVLHSACFSTSFLCEVSCRQAYPKISFSKRNTSIPPPTAVTRK
jgi:hypothetical protein